MSDNEIIKALECCTTDKCKGCPLFNVPKVKGCMKLMENALDLINRQKAEIESLNEKERILIFQLAEEHEKAIKEFAEKLKEEYPADGRYQEITNTVIRIFHSTIDNLVKEMVGERK